MQNYPILLIVLIFSTVLAQKRADFKKWDDYKKNFNKTHPHEEDTKRMEFFLNNKLFVEEHNEKHKRDEVTYSMKVNKFADWLPHEIDGMNGLDIDDEEIERLQKEQANKGKKRQMYIADVPEYVNWAERGAVTPVKDQGACGCCYTFSAAGALEGMMFMKNEPVVELSKQNLIDCTDKFNNSGCLGGMMHNCFKYVAKNKGINTERAYPYEKREGECRFSKSDKKVTNKGYEIVTPYRDEEALKVAVATVGPISVGFYTAQSFLFYNGGIYSSVSCDKKINHAMLLVGYGTEKGTDYWIIKNSWGEDWGEKGYARVLRNVNNMCRIADYAVYPL